MTICSQNLTRSIYYRPQTKLGEGNVLTAVCLFTRGGGFLPSMHHRSHDQHPRDLHPESASRVSAYVGGEGLRGGGGHRN